MSYNTPNLGQLVPRAIICHAVKRASFFFFSFFVPLPNLSHTFPELIHWLLIFFHGFSPGLLEF